ncbi:hypothetical protein Y032_0020g89 [Ancylostoma ceylanicum]|uniref:C2H2-type domain-containing protein n=2 Tax=Ancylostoma ceylanicum TaxID=53326 RepID=A0A016V0R5_9BILA|nr:hypothetical protein Y032_0020g89 [Ancylostoma ceylanicum]
MKEPFKFFRPWEDTIPPVRVCAPVIVWHLLPSTSSSFIMPENSSNIVGFSPCSSDSPEISPIPALPTKRQCVRCKCAFCRMRKAGEMPSDKPVHVCDVPNCGKTYKKTSHLKAHLRSHIGSRPFECHWWQCGKKFSRSDQLQRHLRAHTGERRHTCPLCGRSFARSDHLKQHQTSQHTMEERMKQ